MYSQSKISFFTISFTLFLFGSSSVHPLPRFFSLRVFGFADALARLKNRSATEEGEVAEGFFRFVRAHHRRRRSEGIAEVHRAKTRDRRTEAKSQGEETKFLLK
uniref:Secreted protein n=1 Tax=Pediastrum duplex TaxID=3105 RepID=A0A2U8GIF8_PEDDU|nr:hypothetical protein [Pediastrum duplex]